MKMDSKIFYSLPPTVNSVRNRSRLLKNVKAQCSSSFSSRLKKADKKREKNIRSLTGGRATSVPGRSRNFFCDLTEPFRKFYTWCQIRKLYWSLQRTKKLFAEVAQPSNSIDMGKIKTSLIAFDKNLISILCIEISAVQCSDLLKEINNIEILRKSFKECDDTEVKKLRNKIDDHIGFIKATYGSESLELPVILSSQ
ncbi:hypothetical protein [Rugamonas aquatica]|uniref:Uncharacterized protein n=1 Tax=Rugamonas aquatica TaxID=2743357 RepID=A0A6A7N6L4_9BURK|nr:hypothetical protein [Rugamonas aquatica]MQA40700.1 hypothetical protein [Rugamonas aquatica]